MKTKVAEVVWLANRVRMAKNGTMARSAHIADTIAAIATPPGEGALAIVRVSGASARVIAEACLRAAADPERFVALAPRVATYCLVVDAQLEPIDEVVAVYYAAPRSFTGEDMLELICHGGQVVTGRVLAAMVASGARVAQPGEFTRRAFIEGRIDLAKAEAIGALIHAQSEAAARVALRQLRGGLSERINAASGLLLDVLALTEAYIDFPEERLPAAQRALRDEKLDAAEDALDELVRRTDTTLVSRAGARVVLAGAPNAGKSSLFNALVGRERALVADLPGTTRDTVEAAARLGDVRLTLVDTAGMREIREGRATTATHGLAAPRRMLSDPTRPVTHADVEQMGIERAREEVVGADVMLWVFDGAMEPSVEEENALASLAPTCPAIRVTTKCDRVDFRVRAGSIPVSSRSGEGLDALRAMIREHVTKTEVADPLVIETRHAGAIERARAAVRRARVAFSKVDEAAAGATSHPDWVDDSGELAATDLREAVVCLGEITGTRDHAALNDAVLDRIFSTFCIGK